MSRLLKGEDCRASESNGSELPERFGAFAPLLASGEANRVLIVDVRSHGYYDVGSERIAGSIRIKVT